MITVGATKVYAFALSVIVLFLLISDKHGSGSGPCFFVVP